MKRKVLGVFFLLLSIVTMCFLRNYEITVETGTFKQYTTYAFEADDSSKQDVFVYALLVSLFACGATCCLLTKLSFVKQMIITMSMEITCLMLCFPKSLLRLCEVAYQMKAGVWTLWYLYMVLIELCISGITLTLVNYLKGKRKRRAIASQKT